MGKRGPIGSNKRSIRNVATAAEPAMPAGLSTEAQAEWRRVTDLLRARTVLDALDQTALNDYITCWVRLRECEADIAARGVLVEGGGGRGKVKNQCCQIGRQYRDHLLGWCREFGFTPTSRARIQMPKPIKPEDQDPWAQF